MTDALTGREPGEPFVAVKLGSIVFLGGRNVSLAGIGGPHEGRGGDRLYEADATARCAKGQLHTVPDVDCGCGFWSVPDRSVLAALFPYAKRLPYWFEMDVEAFGRVVVHDVGVRSSRQRVLGVNLPDRCGVCGERTDRFAAAKPAEALEPRCALHVPDRKGSAVFTGLELAAALGTEVSRTVSSPDTVRARLPRQGRQRLAAVLAAVLTPPLAALAAWQVVSDRPLPVPATEATFAGLSRADTESVLAQAAAAVAGGVLADDVVLSTSTVSLYPVVAGPSTVGVVALVDSGAVSKQCAVMVRPPVPAFTADMLGGDMIVDASGTEWVVSTRSRADAYTCFEWVSALEQTLTRLTR